MTEESYEDSIISLLLSLTPLFQTKLSLFFSLLEVSTAKTSVFLSATVRF